MNPHVFTLQEANACISALKPIVDRLSEKKRLMQQRHDQLLVLDLIGGEKIHDYHSSDGKEYLEKSADLENLLLSFEEDIMKVNQLGCFLRDVEQGVVDFFHVMNRELVYLCWRKNEKKISFFHDLDANDRKRKPL